MMLFLLNYRSELWACTFFFFAEHPCLQSCDVMIHRPYLQIPSFGLAVDHEFDVAVDFRAPKLPGRYISFWRMALPSGEKFGQRVWVLIQVRIVRMQNYFSS